MSVQESVTVSCFVDTSATIDTGICHGQAGEYKLESITLVPFAALAESGSNKYVIAFSNGSDSVATSYDTSASGNVLAAQTAKAISVTGTAGAALEFGATDVLKITATKTGTANLKAHFVCAFSKVRV
tara:strand:+ start:1436 stop:1819 length:384 start_codon:yes stop_codon:yes gene_type:complete